MLAVVLVAALLLSLQLLVPPVIGLANNGDFERVMGPVGFQYLTQDPAEKYFYWINTKFAYAPAGWYSSGLITSESILARVARAAAVPFASGGPFDIRILGAVHILLLLAGLGLLASGMAPLPRQAQWVGAVLLVLVFTDVGYAAPLNSFYSQTASLLFLLLTLGVLARWIARPGPDPRFAVPLFLFAGLFVLSKPQEAIQAPWLALAGLRLAMADEGRAKAPRRLAPLAGAVLLCVLGAWYYRQTPPEIADVARYHKVFMELLPDSPDPGQDLADLGLDPSWTRAIGKTAYGPTSPFHEPAFRAAFLERFSYGRLARFYLTHPARLSSAIRRGGLAALRLRHPRFGNFERSAGFPPGTRTGSFAWWSDGRLALPGHPLVWIGLLFLGNAIAIAATYGRASPAGRLAREAIVLLMAMASTAFAVCVLSNAHADLARHFYVFHALCDLVVIADAVWAALRLSAPSRAPAS